MDLPCSECRAKKRKKKKGEKWNTQVEDCYFRGRKHEWRSSESPYDTRKSQELPVRRHRGEKGADKHPWATSRDLQASGDRGQRRKRGSKPNCEKDDQKRKGKVRGRILAAARAHGTEGEEGGAIRRKPEEPGRNGKKSPAREAEERSKEGKIGRRGTKERRQRQSNLPDLDRLEGGSSKKGHGFLSDIRKYLSSHRRKTIGGKEEGGAAIGTHGRNEAVYKNQFGAEHEKRPSAKRVERNSRRAPFWTRRVNLKKGLASSSRSVQGKGTKWVVRSMRRKSQKKQTTRSHIKLYRTRNQKKEKENSGLPCLRVAPRRGSSLGGGRKKSVCRGRVRLITKKSLSALKTYQTEGAPARAF